MGRARQHSLHSAVEAPDDRWRFGCGGLAYFFLFLIALLAIWVLGFNPPEGPLREEDLNPTPHEVDRSFGSAATQTTEIMATSTTLDSTSVALDLNGQWSWLVDVTEDSCDPLSATNYVVDIVHDLTTDAVSVSGLLGDSGNSLSGRVRRSPGSLPRLTLNGSYPEDDGTTQVIAITLSIETHATAMQGREIWKWTSSTSDLVCDGRSDLSVVLDSPR